MRWAIACVGSSSHATPLYLGAIARGDARDWRGSACCTPRAAGGADGRSSRLRSLLLRHPRDRCCHRAGAAVIARMIRASAAPATGSDGNDVPSDARTMVIVPTHAHVGGARRTNWSTTSRCWRSPISIRTSISRCSSDFADAASARRRRTTRAPRRRSRADRRADGPIRSRAPRSLLSLPPRPPVERPRAGLDGLGTQARQDRGVQSAAARRHRHELRRPARADLDLLPSVRYCITLDSDTLLPRDAAAS